MNSLMLLSESNRSRIIVSNRSSRSDRCTRTELFQVCSLTNPEQAYDTLCFITNDEPQAQRISPLNK